MVPPLGVSGAAGMKCFECGKPAIQKHHIVPRIRGGKRTIPMCDTCHGKIHGTKGMSISVLTKEGLATAKQRGVKFGNPNPAVAAKKGCQGNIAAAKEHHRDILPLARKLRKAGWTLTQIGDTLTYLRMLTRRGKAWSATAVMRLLER